MNTKSLLAGLLLLALGAGAGQPALAAPRYTDKENALALAQALDKGVFRDNLISSAFIQSRSTGNYLIKVVLDNGAEQDWDLHQIRNWSKDDSLTLRKNRALVFPSEDTNGFVVLDKNQFATRALRARVYAKRHKGDDILAGRTIAFTIYRFNLIELLNLAPSTDENGYRHRYVLDLENGQREFLSYREAHEVMARDGLSADPGAMAPVLTLPFRLEDLRAEPLGRMADDGTGRFGVTLVFDKAVPLEPSLFPFRLYEQTRPAGRNGPDSRFVIEFTVPNAVLAKRVATIRHLEFLNGVRVVTDPENQVRLLLKAEVNPDVLTVPPQVETGSSQDVRITFTKVIDQSVFDRKALEEAELRRRQDRMLHATLTAEEITARKDFQRLMGTGRDEVDRARNAPTFGQQVELLLAALANFRAAAETAYDDRALQDALRERNQLSVRLPTLIVEHVGAALARPPVQDAAGLQRLLDHAAALTRDETLLETIARYKGRLVGP